MNLYVTSLLDLQLDGSVLSDPETRVSLLRMCKYGLMCVVLGHFQTVTSVSHPSRPRVRIIANP
jgi:hypothetical protein